MNRPMAGRTILVVEDEMMILISIETMLADLGCEHISAAATVDAALGLIEHNDFDLAMLDVNLNGAKSFAVADALAARAVPFLFCTGYTDPGNLEGHGGRPVLNKPYHFERLGATLSGLLRHAKHADA